MWTFVLDHFEAQDHVSNIKKLWGMKKERDLHVLESFEIVLETRNDFDCTCFLIRMLT